MRRLNAVVNRLIALIPESREAFIARASQGCIDALAEGREEPLEDAPEYAMCYQGGVPCLALRRCPVLGMRSSGR
jgi:hypothetical protein